MDQNMLIIVMILFFHWIADFVVQTDVMAKGKSHSVLILTKHIAAYAFTMVWALVAALIVLESIKTPQLFSFSGICLFVLINASLHFLIDFVTSRASSLEFSREATHNAFVIIGFDQFLHTSILLLTYHLILV